MSAHVVYLDHEHAKIFKLLPGNVETTVLKAHLNGHDSVSDPAHHKPAKEFFHRLAENLKGATELLLVGPGLGKTHFKDHLEEHHHAELLKKIVGIETSDYISDGQVLKLARKFFKVNDLYA